MRNTGRSDAVKIYIVSYDIASNKLCRKIEKSMKNFGRRLQKSVFICTLESDQLPLLHEKIQGVLDQNNAIIDQADNVVIIGSISSEKLIFFAGKPCGLEDFMIY